MIYFLGNIPFMLTSLTNFDPLTFLDINSAEYDSQDADYLKSTLMNEMGKYVLLKLAEKLPEDQVKNSLSKSDKPEDILKKLNELDPNWEQDMCEALEQFKIDFKQNN